MSRISQPLDKHTLYTHTHTQLHAYMYTHLRRNIPYILKHTHLDAYMYTYTHIHASRKMHPLHTPYTHLHTPPHIHTPYIHIHTPPEKHTLYTHSIHTYTYLHAYMYTHLRANTHTYTFTHIAQKVY